ncbi:MAG: FAD-dependent oxidoreductase [Candidatus Hydrogenedens sp.]|jgi:NADH-quinone oxidoreductase subunit F|nr:FAD-dependent oxidoreductase [Candidatus Hydrogenedens sp.]
MTFLDAQYKSATAQWLALMESEQPVIYVGAATCGLAAGAGAVLAFLHKEIEKASLDARVVEVGCLGPCYLEPLVIVHKPGKPRICYGNIGAGEMGAIVENWLKGDDPCRQWSLGTLGEETLDGIPPLAEHPVMARQVRRILNNCGIIDPSDLNHYLAREGYRGFLKALELGPEKTLEEVKRSGLRGRGGAGFPTFKKWEFCRNSPGEKRYLICNCSEGDPGSFMNRSLIEGDPHALLEGMLIAGFAMNATAGYIYCGVEYATVLKRLNLAIEQMRTAGLLGDKIGGSDFSFDIIVKRGAGAYVCGEETALIAAIESRRGMPRPRPPFPAASGLWGYPTNIQNVETLGNLPLILRKGADWYTSCGTENNKGTRSFSMAGSIRHPGLIEVPLGMTLKDIIYDVGGGAPMGRKIKAVQTGGPSGGCLPAHKFDLPVEYEALAEAGSIMGSGGMIVLDEQCCIVDLVRYFLTFTQNESCGKCPPCRVGTRAMLALVTTMAEGRATMEDLATLESIARTVKQGSLCGLGQTAANPVLCTLQYFREEYEAHILEKRCPAGVCTALTRTNCMSACAAGLYIPGMIALVGEQRYEEALKLHRDRNPFASVCASICTHPCENRCERRMTDESVSIQDISLTALAAEKEPALPEQQINEENARRKVAVVGGGPAGLSCAFFLARLGYKPVLYEESDEPGGLLLSAVPDFRFPKDIFRREIEMIRRLGVEIRCNQKLGKDFTLQSLRDEGCEALFLARGAAASASLKIPGEDTEGGVVDALTFLRDTEKGGGALTDRRVLVVGGNDAAVDAARRARQEGAAEVSLLYRRTRREMSARDEYLEIAEGEGIRIYPLVSPVEVISQEGRVQALRCIRMEMVGHDISGRRGARPVAESEFDLSADLVITAVGREADASLAEGEIILERNAAGYIKVDPHSFATSVDWIFAGGEEVSGPGLAIAAIAAGEEAAVAVDRFLTGSNHAFWRKIPELDISYDPRTDLNLSRKMLVDRQMIEKDKDSFEELVLPFTEEIAISQAARCLRCDFCAEVQDQPGAVS